MSRTKQLGIIGLGRIGRCMVQGLLRSNTYARKQIIFTTKHESSRKQIEQELGLQSCKDNVALIESCKTIVIAVKPQSVGEVLAQIKGKVKKDQIIVSVAASMSTHFYAQVLGREIPIIRAMPNIPAFVGAAMTPVCLGGAASPSHWKKVEGLFQPLGESVLVDERHMDAVTGLSGCGPAYIYVVLESLTEAGIKVGLPRDLATQLSAQTVLGASKMLLETGRHPASLKDEVTTPAGCTIDGLIELEEGKLRVTLIKAVVQATKRAKELGIPSSEA